MSEATDRKDTGGRWSEACSAQESNRGRRCWVDSRACQEGWCHGCQVWLGGQAQLSGGQKGGPDTG
jgi:hypothetical protein